MAKLVSNMAQAAANIRRFSDEVASGSSLRDVLAYNRAWYAEEISGGWAVGPSKFIGYDGMTDAAYDPQSLNGRETERQLAQWYTQLHPVDPLFAEIDQALRNFLSLYGKTPSSLYRINISNKRYEEMTGNNTNTDGATIADLLIAVARRLPQVERDRVRAAL